MATKYTRETVETPASRIAERLEAHRQLRAAGPLSFRPGGGGLFLSLGAVIFALMLFQTAVDRMLAEAPPAAAATATVTAKAGADPEALSDRPLLRLSIALEDGVLHEVWVPTDPDSWESVSEGDQLAVEYTRERGTGALRIVRMRIVEVEPPPAESTEAAEPTQ